MNKKGFLALKRALLERASAVGSYLRDRPRMSTGVAIAIVLGVMALGAYVSFFLPRQRMDEALAAYTAGDFNVAIELAGKVVDADARNVDATLLLVAAILQQAQLDGTLKEGIAKARELLLVADRFSPNNAEVQRQLGYTYLLEKDLPNAKIHLSKAVELAPNSPAAHAYLCAYFNAANENDSAVAACERSLVLDPYNAYALIAGAQATLEAKDFKRARLYAESAIAYATDRVTQSEAYSVAAFVAVHSFDLELGRMRVEESIKLNPKNVESLVLFGEIAMRTMGYEAISGKDPRESEDWTLMLSRAAEAMRSDPGNYYPYLLFMRAYEISGNASAAASHRERARRLVNNDTTLTDAERAEIIERLDAAKNIKVTSVRLLPAGYVSPEGAQKAYIIEP